MKQFVELPDKAPMAEAGPHFPVVCRAGEPVGVPERLRVTSRTSQDSLTVGKTRPTSPSGQ